LVRQEIAFLLNYIQMTETKAKGLTNELLCEAYLTSLGYNVSIPLGEECRYDLILDIKG